MPFRFLAFFLIFSSQVTLLASPFSFRHYRVEQGLASNGVRDILQDRRGFIWIATDGGLNRFDGHDFKRFATVWGDTLLAENRLFYCLFEDSRGKLWAGSEEGLFCYDSTREQFIRFGASAGNDPLIDVPVWALAEDGKGRLWVGTHGKGVLRVLPDSDQIEQVLLPDGYQPGSARVASLISDSRGTIWVAFQRLSDPLLYLPANGDNLIRFKPDPGYKKLDGISICNLFEDSNGLIWITTWDDGLLSLDRNSGEVEQHLFTKGGAEISHIHSIAELASGELLIGSDYGLSHYRVQSRKHSLITPDPADSRSLSNRFVYPIFKDREGGVWVGTFYGGLNYMAPGSPAFERYFPSSAPYAMQGYVVSTFCEGLDGEIWVGTDDGGLHQFSPSTQRFTHITPSNAQWQGNVHALCLDGNTLWVGTYTDGLFQLDTRQGRLSPFRPSGGYLPSDLSSVYSLYKDNTGVLWAGTMSGIHHFDPQTGNFVRNMWTGTTVMKILQDPLSRIWFATQGRGLWMYDKRGETWSQFHTSASDSTTLPGNVINDICFDAGRRMWVATDGGLCYFDPAKNHFVRVSLPLTHTVVCGVVADRGLLWLTTLRGLVRFDPESGKGKIFYQSHGLQSDQFTTGALFRSREGKIYAGTSHGFNAFHPGQILDNPHEAPLAITQIQLFNRELPVSKEGILRQSPVDLQHITFSHHQNVFSVAFVALSYVNPERNLFAYKLEGFDNEWSYGVDLRKATYTNLAAGNYTLRIRGANSDGVWNQTEQTLSLTILPPFWLSPLFLVLYWTLGIGLLLFLIYYFHKRWVTRQQRKADELFKARESELHQTRMQFFTHIAHEIRTPLTLILAPIEQMRNHARGIPSHIEESLQTIERNSRHLLSLAQQWLDFQKADSGTFRMHFLPVKPDQLLVSVCRRFEPLFSLRNIRFVMNLPENLPLVNADADALEKIVGNLIGNAIKYTDNRVELTCVHLVAQHRLSIRVSDNGKGVPEAEREKIWKPFYQVAGSDHSGAGIGLSLVKLLVDAHKGTLQIYNNNPGATFEVQLPLGGSPAVVNDETKTAPSDETIVDLSDSPVIDTAMTLLIVEDDDEMRNFLAGGFATECSVLTASNGAEALLFLEKQLPDLVITDIMMPEIDGITLCREIKQNVLWCHIPVIALTAKTDMASKIEGLQIGADAYIEKPFSPAFLRAQVWNLIESRRLLRKRFSEMPLTRLSGVGSHPADNEFLSKVDALIESHISDAGFSIDQMAVALCVSRSGLFAKIKQMTGFTPNDLIRIMRLKRAAQLLSERRYRINEVALLVGFNSPSYFAKSFFQQFKTTPKDFVKQLENP